MVKKLLQTSNDKSLGVALILNSFPLTGLLGFDKFYIGRNGLGILQIVLTITVIGLLVNIPLTFINQIGLLILILAGTSTALYPSVKWGPITNFDKIVAYVVIALTILTIVVSIIKGSTTKKTVGEKDNIDSMML